MIGIVVVSHSRALAEAAVALASEMVEPSRRPRVAIAAGLPDGSFGTDATAIQTAIEDLDSPAGVWVVTDLGSAVLSTDLAVELCSPTTAARVVQSAAPLVEGLVAGMVTAATGADLARVESEARGALTQKAQHVGAVEPCAAAGCETASVQVIDPRGLHARPLAAMVQALKGLDAEVSVRNLTAGGPSAPGDSITRLMALGVLQGHRIEVTATGPQAAEAIRAVQTIAGAAEATAGD